MCHGIFFDSDFESAATSPKPSDPVDRPVVARH